MVLKSRVLLWEGVREERIREPIDKELGGRAKPPVWPAWRVWLYIAFVVIVLVTAMLLAVRADHAHRPPLETFTPVIKKMVEWNQCHRLLGFDREGHFYVWNHVNHEVLQLTPAGDASMGEKEERCREVLESYRFLRKDVIK